MSKLKKNSSTTVTLNEPVANELEATTLSKLNISQNLNSPRKKTNLTQQQTNSSSKKLSANSSPTLQSSPQNQNQSQMKRRQIRTANNTIQDKEYLRKNEEFETSKLEPIPITYCININQDGYPNMDRACHLNEEELENRLLENKLRPISGIRNHLKRNMSSLLSSRLPPFDFVKDTDIIQRIASVKTLKRLDLSFNNLQTYPRQLCELSFLETLNLTGNNLTENDFPIEMEKHQNLIELIVDGNNCKRISKNICKCKRLNRLSMRHNNLNDLKHVDLLKKLRFLIIDYNNLTNLDDTIRSLEKLEVLQVNNNSLQTLDANLFKSSLSDLKHLNLSFNKLSSISVDVFMLPNLETLNLSNNNLTRLPLIPNNTNFRTSPIYSLDLSSNQLVRYYDFLLNIARNVDLSCNRIRNIQSKSIQKLTNSELNSKRLKLNDNPIVDPPIDIAEYSLRELKEYFDEESKCIQFNKGFKILILGDQKSGKTSLAYALEDFNSQSNLIEQSNVNTNNAQLLEDISESKLMEIHEFSLNEEEEEDFEKATNQSQSDIRVSSSLSFKSQKSDLKRINSSLSTKSNDTKNKIITNLVSNSFRTVNSTIPKKTSLPVTIYDFNGSITQYGHLFDLFVDKTALILLCIDCTNYTFTSDNASNAEKTQNFEFYLANLLDLVFLKMSKNTSYYILPVLTKCDKIPKGDISSAQTPTRAITLKVENFIKNHLNTRINDIHSEMKKIEQLSHISASQSDRLKHLVQTQTNLNPEIYKKCLTSSSLKMQGIGILTRTIKEIVLGNKKHFPNVNEKVPAFWTEVENYAIRVLGEVPTTRIVNDKLKIITRHGLPSMSMLCVDYNEYKEKIVEKYGMSHLIEQITKYMNSSGKIIWYQDSLYMKTKVFLRPALLFELYFVLFRKNFKENFTDSHMSALRAKLVNNSMCINEINESNTNSMISDLLEKGQMHIDLLKLLWFPILILDSVQILYEIVTLFMYFFNLGYPLISKEKSKEVFQSYLKEKNDLNKFPLHEPDHSTIVKPQLEYTVIVIPFYLPVLKDKSEILKTKQSLQADCQACNKEAVKLKLRKEKIKLSPKISQKYTFPWGLISGIFEKFSTNCIINSNLYYKVHYKNFIHAANEENDIEILIYQNASNENTSDELEEIIFEFYLLNYQQILESLEQSEKLQEENFEQTLSNDLDHIWVLSLKILNMFEETISSTYPSLRYDRFSLCPECEKFSFIGEWLTPKELQKYKSKACSACEKIIDYSFLVKPTSAQHMMMDFKKMSLRLENLAKHSLKQTSPLVNTSTLNSKSGALSDVVSVKSKSKSSV